MGDWTTCRYVIEGPNGAEPGRNPRPWWRRYCKRAPVEGSDFCWQHGGKS